MSEQPPPPSGYFKKFTQIGVVVRDIEKAARHLTNVFGIGPFNIIDWPPAGREDMPRFYYGQPAHFTARMAFLNLGNAELELIQPVSDDSIWADFLREHGEGIHHIRFNVEDTRPVMEDMAERGIQSIQHGSGIRPGTTWVNFDSENLVGFIIEIMSVVPGTDGRTPTIKDGKVQL
jgi:methylmalonyl-CoA/ethylmalonyl-CoA epimerase